MVYHKPVLVQEVLSYLNIKPHGLYVDVTFGGGGHTRAILQQEPTCKVISFDWDMIAIENNGYPLQEEFPGRLTLVWANFSQIDKQLKKIGIEHVDGILADFGTSQYQLTQRPGFSFASDTPLDMRMSPPHQKMTAAELVNKAQETTLCEIFKEYGQEPKARAVAREIVKERSIKPIKTTAQLARIIQRVIPRTFQKMHPATRVFQAIRIYINKELDNIESFLPAALRVLNPGGRLVCISFHSLEDRIVKQFFKEQEKVDTVQIMTDKIVTATPEELAENPSSRSARLRCAEFLK